MSYKKILFLVSFLAMAFFMLSFSLPQAKAYTDYTAEELLQMIEELQRQIAELHAKLSDLRPEPVWCHDFNVNLGVGHTQTEVRALQTVLQKEGLYQRDITGRFDEYTASAVVNFQEKYADEILAPWGLVRGTGYVGRTTREKLNDLYGCPPVVEPSITVTSPREGDELVLDETHEISWEMTGVDNPAIDLYKAGEFYSSMVRQFVRPVFSYTWIISRTVDEPGDDYRLKVYDYNNPEIFDKTGPFNIVEKDGLTCDQKCKSLGYQLGTCKTFAVSPGGFEQKEEVEKTHVGIGWTADCHNRELLVGIIRNCYCYPKGPAKPFITVIYPKGGEEWVIGETYNIQWEDQNIDRVDIYLYKSGFADCRTVYRLAANISVDLGEYSFTVPSDMCPYEIDPLGKGYTVQFWHPDAFDVPDPGAEWPPANLIQESNYISIVEEDKECFVSGCSRELCAKEPLFSTCEYLPGLNCLREEGVSCQLIEGKCQWVLSEKAARCFLETEEKYGPAVTATRIGYLFEKAGELLLLKDWDVVLGRADVNNDGTEEFFVARLEADPGYLFRIYAISRDGEKFEEVWKSPRTFWSAPEALRVAVGDLDNSGRNEILIESSTNFPDFSYTLFEYNEKTEKVEGSSRIFREMMIKKAEEIDNFWYQSLKGIEDYTGDGQKEILMQTVVWKEDTPEKGPVIPIKWHEITE